MWAKKFLCAGRYKIAPVPIRFQKKIEVEFKEIEEEKEKNKKNGEKEEKKFKIEIVEEVKPCLQFWRRKSEFLRSRCFASPISRRALVRLH